MECRRGPATVSGRTRARIGHWRHRVSGRRATRPGASRRSPSAPHRQSSGEDSWHHCSLPPRRIMRVSTALVTATAVMATFAVAFAIACGGASGGASPRASRPRPARARRRSPTTSAIRRASLAAGPNASYRSIPPRRKCCSPWGTEATWLGAPDGTPIRPAARSVADLGDGLRPNVEAVLAVHPDLVVLYAATDNRDAAQRLPRRGHHARSASATTVSRTSGVCCRCSERRSATASRRAPSLIRSRHRWPG